MRTAFDCTDDQIQPRFSFQKCWDRAVEKGNAEAELLYPPHQEAARAEAARSLTLKYYRQMIGVRSND